MTATAIPTHVTSTPVETLVRQVNDEHLILDPSDSRKWSSKQCNAFLTSLVLGHPLGAITINSRDGERVIDGIQRLMTLHRFFTGDLIMSLDQKLVSELTGGKQAGSIYLSYGDLIASARRAVDDVKVAVYRTTVPQGEESSLRSITNS